MPYTTMSTRVLETSAPSGRQSLGRDASIAIGLLVLLSAAPFLLEQVGRPFWVDIALRGMILAIAAVSLNFVVGLGGLVSLGHGAFFGLGAYSVGILAYYDTDSGWLQLLCTVAVTAIFGLISGLISLRTRGVHFIMITLAFGQMAYFVMVGLSEFGGDDGLTLNYGSTFAPFFDLSDRMTLYYVTLAVLAASMFGFARIRNAGFGLLLRSAKSNERRVSAMGFNVVGYRLAAYVGAGVLCGVAGFLDANFTSFVTPDFMSWTGSAELIFIVIVGGVSTIAGPLVGALIFLVLEEWGSGLTVYWHFWFGAFLIGVALFARGGLVALLVRGTAK